jgi:hypothetical protein
LLISVDQTYTIMDYKSSNGVHINGEAIFREELRPGDELEIGEAVCEFTIETEFEGRWREHFEGFEGAFQVRPFLKVLQRAGGQSMLQERERFQFLLDAVKDLAEADTPRAVGIRALHAALTGLEASRGFLALWQDEERYEIVNSVGIAPERIQQIPFYLALMNRARSSLVMVRTTPNFADFVHHEPRLIIEDIGSALACPLLGTQGVLACLYIDRNMVEPGFSAAEEEPLSVLARGVGLGLETSLWREEIEEGLGAVEILGEDLEDEGINCGVCGETAQLGTREVVICDRCNAVHHQDCWDYNGGCTRFGCGGFRSKSLSLRLADLTASD